jgi:hypothetical protein
MMRRIVVTAALAGLVLFGVAAQEARGEVEGACYACVCGDASPPDFLTKCSNSPLVDFSSQCPPCTGEYQIKIFPSSCNEVAACRPFLSRAPALSHVPLVGLGVLLAVGGIWRTRNRMRTAS